MKIFIAYDSKHGNTKLAAESILAGIRETEDVENSIDYVKEIDAKKLAEFDAIILGAPNHMGRPSLTMKKFIDKLSSLELKARYVAVFGTYAGRVRSDRAVKKLEKMLEQKLPKLSLIAPGLSIRVNGITGPIVNGELHKCFEFGKNITTKLKTNN